MLISILKKYWKNIIDAIIIVGIIVVLFIYNPWNLFGSGLKLQNTANNISAIKEIGQLITAEYYGEAISTIDQSRLQIIFADDLNARANILFQQIKNDLHAIYQKSELDDTDSTKKRRKKRQQREYRRDIESIFNEGSEIKNDSLYQFVLEYYRRNKVNNFNDIDDRFKDKDEKETLQLLLNELIEAAESNEEEHLNQFLESELPVHNDEVFSDFYYNKRSTQNDFTDKKKELAMIGRGWVKAGFNFDKLNEQNFYFDEESGIIHLFGVHPEILNADINPWFIPEKKIPGFQIITANKNVDFNDAILVKTYCIKKLQQMALDAGILKAAEEQGKEALKNFISMISTTEVKDVYFHYDALTTKIDQIISDDFINYQEGLVLDTLIQNKINEILILKNSKTNFSNNQRLSEIKIQQLKATIAQLQNCWFEKIGQTYSRFSTLIYNITADSIITENELKFIDSLKWNMNELLPEPKDKYEVENKVWYTNKLDFISEFNRAIDSIQSCTKYYGNLIDTVFQKKSDSKSFIETIGEKAVLTLSEFDSVVHIQFLAGIYPADSLDQIKYPVSVPSDWQEQIKLSESIGSLEKDRKNKLADTLYVKGDLAKNYDPELQSNLRRIPVIKTEKSNWQIDPSWNNNSTKPDKKLYFEFLINSWKEKENEGVFTKANQWLKNTLAKNQ